MKSLILIPFISISIFAAATQIKTVGGFKTLDDQKSQMFVFEERKKMIDKRLEELNLIEEWGGKEIEEFNKLKKEKSEIEKQETKINKNIY